MSTDRRVHYSYEEYLGALEDSDIKLEYFDGEISAMASGTLAHAELGARAIAQLTQALANACRVLTSDAKVQVEATGLATFPDATIACGDLKNAANDPNALVNPAVLIEVTSKGTEDYDRGEKLSQYRQIPSLRAVLLISEHGPGADDEVSRLPAGANGGWNPVGANGQYNGYDGARMTDAAAVPSAVRPVWVNADSQGMSACVFLKGRSWLAYENRLAVGILAGRRVSLLDLNDSLDAVIDEDPVPNVSERVRSLVVGPDEKLYLTTDEGLIVRFSPRAP